MWARWFCSLGFSAFFRSAKAIASEEDLRQQLLEEIGKIRFGEQQNGYIFVVSYDGVTLMNDTMRQLIGKNIWHLTDPDGVKVIQEERRAVENPAGDFIYYSWNKPSTKKPSPKTSFMKGIDDSRRYGWSGDGR